MQEYEEEGGLGRHGFVEDYSEVRKRERARERERERERKRERKREASSKTAPRCRGPRNPALPSVCVCVCVRVVLRHSRGAEGRAAAGRLDDGVCLRAVGLLYPALSRAARLS